MTAGPMPARPSRASARTELAWADAVERLDVETTRSALSAFARGEVAGARLFLARPMAALARAWLRAPHGRRATDAVLAGYGALVHAGKLWDEQRRWREA